VSVECTVVCAPSERCRAFVFPFRLFRSPFPRFFRVLCVPVRVPLVLLLFSGGLPQRWSALCLALPAGGRKEKGTNKERRTGRKGRRATEEEEEGLKERDAARRRAMSAPLFLPARLRGL
jgi:hypothetical protein